MSRNLVTVKTRAGYLRVPAKPESEPAKAEPIETPEPPAPEPEAAEPTEEPA